MQDASARATPALGGRGARGGGGGGGGGRRTRSGGAGRASGGGYGRQMTRDHSAFKEHLVSATKGFIQAIMLGKKKWSALVQQVRVGMGVRIAGEGGGGAGCDRCLDVRRAVATAAPSFASFCFFFVGKVVHEDVLVRCCGHCPHSRWSQDKKALVLVAWLT